ncbi:uncharacterized protein LOC141914914 [Tubulanus polymorphus]|uniref:uncharacterized protein LOC141914914 n=1 Tax=Tubulanus polymorphus TaxID=672921 RepID=UPI003DA2963D
MMLKRLVIFILLSIAGVCNGLQCRNKWTKVNGELLSDYGTCYSQWCVKTTTTTGIRHHCDTTCELGHFNDKIVECCNSHKFCNNSNRLNSNVVKCVLLVTLIHAINKFMLI